MRTISNYDLGSHSDVHSEECDAVSSFSERQAVLAVASVRALIERSCASGDDFAGEFPVEFLLEIGAIAMLYSWDESGIRPLLPTDVPTPQAAAKDLHDRVVADPLQFRRPGSAKLSQQVRKIWLERFSWTAPETLDFEVVLGKPDEDVLVEAVAQLLWKYRDAARHVAS